MRQDNQYTYKRYTHGRLRFSGHYAKGVSEEWKMQQFV